MNTKVPALLHGFSPPARTDWLRIVGGRGALVFDERGRSYVDGLASLWYCQVGHGRADMADAIAGQVRRLEAFHTFAPFSNEPAEQLAEAIARRLPFEGGRVFLCGSGSEAIDTTIKLVRVAWRIAGQPEREIVVARSHAYHGVTYGGMTAQGIVGNREGFGPLVPGIVHVPHHDLDGVRAVFEANPGRVAAVLTEPIQGAGGVHTPAPGYLEGLRALCDEHGAWLVMDEVICGFGRLGRWFGCEHYGVRPDIITFAKGVSSGYLPVGGVAVSRGVADVIEADPSFVFRHGFTYGGHPTCAAAALANIAILEREGLLERAIRIGANLHDALVGLRDRGLVREVRGAGAVWGAELNAEHDAVAIRDRMLELGVIARPLGGNVVAWCPPLVISDDEIATCMGAFETALVSARTPG